MQHSSTQSIDIFVNGEIKAVPEGLSILELLRVLAIEPDRVAIELNRSIVRRPQWETVRIEANAQLEIVQFVGGG
jgi:sulfur carrier protein